jgi:CxxC motif-containing protein (DUF1111 family)
MTILRTTVLGLGVLALALPALSVDPPPEAPAAFDGRPNGHTDPATFDADKEVFDEQEFLSDGLGPTYNAQSCGECHQNPVSGGVSQITEQRAGRYDRERGFVEHPGGSLIHSRATDATMQERTMAGNNVSAFRASLNTLGDGFVECIPDETFAALIADQAQRSGGRIRGLAIQVPVVEAGGALRIGRFGWKNQHASLVSFSGDAYLNEMGITNMVMGHDDFATENTSNGRSVAQYDNMPDPEDDGADVEIFARFMRATKAPPRDAALAATPAARAGGRLFEQIGCALCHTPTLVTAPAGTSINGGTFTVTAALGNKAFHPFSDFLLHDVGTGDGIVQNGGPRTRNRLRTAPLWGVRTRNRLMHDGASVTFEEAILRHGGEAAFVTSNYRRLTDQQKRQIRTFLESL